MFRNIWSHEENISHKVWWKEIKNANERFYMQDWYLMKDLGKSHFMILTHNIEKIEMII